MADESVSMTGAAAPDALAVAGDEPNIPALCREYELAWSQDPDTDTRLVTMENIRYRRWPGQSPDGLKHHDIYDREGLGSPLPYDGAPDARVFHADDIINSLVDEFYGAFFAAEVKVGGVTARPVNMDAAAELRTVINWLKTGPLAEALIDDVERAAQIKAMVGWVVLHPTWRSAVRTTTRTLTMEQIQAFAQKAAQANPPSPQPSPPGEGEQPTTPVSPQSMIAGAPALIMDPEQEAAAGELLRMFVPDLDAKEARRVVRDLREKGEAEWNTTETSSVGPELAVLCPWYHFIMPIEATANPKYGRLGFVRVMLPEWAVDERAAEEGWENPEFVAAVKNTKGRATPSETTVEDELDENEHLIELIYAFNWASDENGAPGIYCTVFSYQVTTVDGSEAYPEPRTGVKWPKHADGARKKIARAYGKHWLLDLGHKHSPFIHNTMEVTGWRPNDSRGVPDVVGTQQMEIEQQRNMLFINSQLSNTPPLVKRGTVASKLPPEFGPFAIINDAMGQNAYTPLQLTTGAKPDTAFKLYELVKKEGEDYYGLPRGDSVPSRSAKRLGRLVKRDLAKWGEAFWQLAVLAYQNMEPGELAEVIGREPQLSAAELAQFRVTLSYDVRAGDGEWIERLVKWITQILSTGGATGMNLEKLLNLLLRYIDPGLYEEVANDPAGNKTKIFRETRDEINNIALGHKPQAGVDLTEKNPNAQLKMVFAQQIVGANPEFKKLLTPGQPGADEARSENLMTYMKNLQHSYQETVVSKQQGRLGVKEVGGPGEG